MSNVVDLNEKREKERFKYSHCQFVEDGELISLKLNSCDFAATAFEDSIMLNFGEDMAVFLDRAELAQFAYVLGMFLDYDGKMMLTDNDEVMTLL